MCYRFSVQYWTYEQALELPFGVPCCRSKEGLSAPVEETTLSDEIPVDGIGKERDGYVGAG